MLIGTSGTLATLIADEDGRVLERGPAIATGDTIAAVIATAARELGQLGINLGLGAAELVTIKGERTTGLIALQRGAIAYVEVEGKRSTADLEELLLATRWAPELTPPAPKPVAAAPSIPAPSAIFSGDLQSFSVPDVLEFLRNGQRSGTLSLASEGGSAVVQLRKGRIVHASSPTAVSVADFVIAFGLVTPEQLESLGGLPEAQLGRALLERGLVKADDLRRALLARTQGAVRELVTWTGGRFAFDASQTGGAPIPGIDLEVDPQSLLLAIFKEHDEASRR